jgi:hypothetical protein
MKVRYRMGLGIAAVLLTTLTLTAAKTDIADAAMRGDKAAIRTHLEKGANVNAAQSDGATAVHWAVYRGDLEMLKMLRSFAPCSMPEPAPTKLFRSAARRSCWRRKPARLKR